MRTLMRYKKYLAKIEYDDDDKVFHGRVIGIKDVINFEGDCVEELIKAFKESIEDYLAFCKERGEEPDKPYSGKFEIRINPELHARLSVRANEEGISINKFVSEVLQEELT